MIVIAGGDRDAQLLHLIERANTRGLQIFPMLHGLSDDSVVDWCLERNELLFNSEAVPASAAFVRQDVFRYLKDKRNIDRIDARSWKVMFDGWLWSNSTIRLFNRSFAQKESVNKPLALLYAKQAGLQIPSTKIHNSVTEAHRLLETGPVAYKPVAGGDYCRELLPANLEKVKESWFPRPYIFQEKLIEPEIRIFRVGDQFFSFNVSSESLDYRVAGSNVRVTEIENPKELLPGLTELTDRLGLNYAAADFKTRATDRQLVFLEVNSNPMFQAFDIACKSKLCDAMLDWLGATS